MISWFEILIRLSKRLGRICEKQPTASRILLFKDRGVYHSTQVLPGRGNFILADVRSLELECGFLKSGWLVAISQFAQERTAESHLRQQGFACYLPKFRERKTVRGAKQMVESYLFGRYFFVRIAERWRSVLGTRGVAEVLLDTDATPFAVPDRNIQEIRDREVNGFVRVDKTRFRMGQSVRIRRGLFAGEVGSFDGKSREEREFALIEFLGTVRRVELSAGNLEAV